MRPARGRHRTCRQVRGRAVTGRAAAGERAVHGVAVDGRSMPGLCTGAAPCPRSTRGGVVLRSATCRDPYGRTNE